VYNVTEYLDEHPGGGEVMLSSAGKDATADFEARHQRAPLHCAAGRPSHALPPAPPQDVGHSSHARSMLAKYEIGAFAGGESARPVRKVVTADGSSSYGAGMTKLLQLLLPLLVILLAVAAFSMQPSAK